MTENLRPNHPELEFSPSEHKLTHEPNEIIQTWTREIDDAGPEEKVWFRTMLCKDGEVMSSLEPSLISAARRGANIRIIFDPISYYISNGGVPSVARKFPIPGRAQIASDYERNKSMVERLRDNGVRMDLSRPENIAREMFPYKGADHIKGVRIGDKFWFGDKNLEDGSFRDMKGFVIEIPNPEMIEYLTEIISSTSSPEKDLVIPIISDPKTQIIWDAGVPGESAIYDSALGIIQQENDSIGTSVQFYPEGRYLEALEGAEKRGTNVSVITTPQEFFGISPYYVVNRINAKRMIHGTVLRAAAHDMQKMVYPNKKTDPKSPIRVTYARPSGVHAKYIVTPGEVEFGTNNHSEWGIKAGTAELAIHSTNPNFVNPINKYHKDLASGLI